MRAVRLASAVLCFVVSLASAQEATNQAGSAGAEPATPPVADIFVARQELETFSRSIGEIDTDDARADWDRRVTAARRALEPVSRAVADGLETLSLEALVDLETQVRGELEAVGEIATVLGTRARTRDRQLDELGARRMRWQTLAAAARTRNAPTEVLDLIQRTEPQIDATAAVLRRDRDAALAALSQLMTLQLDATAFGAEIRTRREQLAEIARRANGLPIWNADLLPTEQGWHDAVPTLTGYVDSILLYLRTNWVPVVFWLFGLWAAAYWLLRATGARVANYLHSESRTMLALAVFDRPQSAALLIGLLGMLALAPAAPVAFRNVVGAVLTFPAAALATTVFARQLRLSVYALAVALSMLSLTPFFQALPIFSRVAFLLQAVLVAVAFYVDLRRGHWQEALSMVPARHLARVVRGFAVLLALIFLTDFVGYLGAANTLRTLVLGGFGLALVFTALGHVLAVLALAVLQVRPFSETSVVRHRSWTIVTFIRRTIRVAAAAGWLVATLTLSGLWPPVERAVLTALDTDVSVGAVTVRLSALASGAVVLLAAWLVGRFIRFVVQSQSLDAAQTAKGTSIAIATLFRYAIGATAFLLALAVMGFDLTRVSVLAGALGVGIGFGLQNVVNNFISGIILLFERPIQVNDIAQVDNLLGTVKEVGVRSTVIRTPDGAEVIVPNGEFIAKSVVNWTKSDRRRRAEIDVGVAYGTDPDRVIEILEAAARSNDEVLKEPDAFAIFTGFGDSALNFRLYVWLADVANLLNAPSAIRAEILRALDKAGIEIPFPQRDIRVTLAPSVGLAMPSAGSGATSAAASAPGSESATR